MRDEILALSKENDALIAEKREKSKLQLLSGASKYMNRAASSVGETAEGNERQSAMIAYLGDALEETKTALRVSEADRWRANGHKMKEMLAQLP